MSMKRREDIENRCPLKDGTIISLQNSNNENSVYRIVKLLSSQGASCLCYLASKKLPYCEVLVILKEFFPSVACDICGSVVISREDVCRKADGLNVSLNLENSYVLNMYDCFTRAVGLLKRCVSNNKLKEYICADDDIDVLNGNGTIYCENLYLGNYKDWYSDRNDGNIKLSEDVLAGSKVIEFEKMFHKELNYAIVDLKPEDIFFSVNISGIPDYSHPYFFDFDAALELCKEYKPGQVRYTKDYCPNSFDDRNAESISINVATENCTFAKVMKRIVENKTKNNELNELIDANIYYDTITQKENMSEEDIRIGLEKIKKKLDDDENTNMGMIYKRRKKINQILRIVIMFILGLMNAVFAVISYDLCINESYENKKFIFYVLLLFIISILTSLLKVANCLSASSLAKMKVSHNYYDKCVNGINVRNSNYNTFRTGKSRYKTTFQDKSAEYKRNQHRRWGLWGILFILLIGSFTLSVVLRSLPILGVIGFPCIIIFMYMDYIPALIDDYRKFAAVYCDKRRQMINLDGKNIKEYRIAKSIRYYEEYINGGFELSADFYKYRNLFKIRKDIITAEYGCGFTDDLQKIFKYDYDKRIEKVQEYQKDITKINFEKYKIKQIYKMGFDRIKNVQLVENIVILLFMLLVVLMTIACRFDFISSYVRLSQETCRILTIILNTVVFLYSIFQILNTDYEEKIAAEMAYKSNFAVDDVLNQLLSYDIACEYIKPVDIARGTSQYANNYVIGSMQVKSRLKNLMVNPRNMSLLHHREITNRRRLSIAVWCIFGSIFSLLVWHCKIYWMLPILLMLFVMIHVVFRNLVLPNCGKKKLVSDIQKLQKD